MFAPFIFAGLHNHSPLDYYARSVISAFELWASVEKHNTVIKNRTEQKLYLSKCNFVFFFFSCYVGPQEIPLPDTFINPSFQVAHYLW